MKIEENIEVFELPRLNESHASRGTRQVEDSQRTEKAINSHMVSTNINESQSMASHKTKLVTAATKDERQNIKENDQNFAIISEAKSYLESGEDEEKAGRANKNKRKTV